MTTAAEIRREFAEKSSRVASSADVEELRIAFLGRKGKVTALFQLIGAVDAEERPRAGAELNSLRDELTRTLQQLKQQEKDREERAAFFDPTLPGR
ncbi:MAG: hypothetical protein ONB12_12785, partial [candidate division KSB1 bacterium]|nr:hypothetical protein [candidate division KSB1 bacterium]